VPLSVNGDEIVRGIVNEPRKIGNEKAAYLGFSFGSAMTGLSGAVDAAIVNGGLGFGNRKLAELALRHARHHR
jgi:hypothetical protein